MRGMCLSFVSIYDELRSSFAPMKKGGSLCTFQDLNQNQIDRFRTTRMQVMETRGLFSQDSSSLSSSRVCIFVRTISHRQPIMVDAMRGSFDKYVFSHLNQRKGVCVMMDKESLPPSRERFLTAGQSTVLAGMILATLLIVSSVAFLVDAQDPDPARLPTNHLDAGITVEGGLR